MDRYVLSLPTRRSSDLGVFSSAGDMAVFMQMLLNEGSYQGAQILSEVAFDLMNTNWNTAYPSQNHGLGWDLNQDWYMDVLAEENSFGHTGYTGTSDRKSVV